MPKYIPNHKKVLIRTLGFAEEEYERTRHNFVDGLVYEQGFRDAWTDLRWQYEKLYCFEGENLIVLDGHDGGPPTYHRMTPAQIKRAAYERSVRSSPTAEVYLRRWVNVDDDFDRLIMPAPPAQPE